MKKLIIPLTILTLTGCVTEHKVKECNLVKRIIDGDTIVLNNNQRVRLICIDTPEKNEYYFQEAKEKLTKLIDNKCITLEKDVSETDRYNRLLRYISLNNASINKIMVKEGYAKVTPYPPDTKYCAEFKKAEKEAKSKNLGIWK